jgi:hypothetical protein
MNVLHVSEEQSDAGRRNFNFVHPIRLRLEVNFRC